MQSLTQTVLILSLLHPRSYLYAWDASGHEIVAMLAEERLTPPVRATVTTLLDGQSMVDVASWPDQIRNQHTAPWHYVNIEIEETQFEPDRHCPDRQCVVGQIERFRETLADPSMNPTKRQKALKYLVHFVVIFTSPCTPAGTMTEAETTRRWSSWDRP